MEADRVTPYSLAEVEEGKSSVTVVQAALGVPSELELVVVSGGPVFLFEGGVSDDDCYSGTHSSKPSFALAASVGMVARMRVPASIGQVTVCADVASIGYFRQVECLPVPFAATGE